MKSKREMAYQDQENQAVDDVKFTAITLSICLLSALTQVLYESETWVTADLWQSSGLSILHFALSALVVASCIYWLIPPGMYGGILAAPSLILLPIVVLSAFAGLPDLLLWVLMLHHIPNVLLGLFRVSLWRGRDASPTQQALAGLCLMGLLPLWFVTRLYWFSSLLAPSLLQPLPDSVVVVGLVVHVLLWLLAAVNLAHYWRLCGYCWRYLAGDMEDLGEVFDVLPKAPQQEMPADDEQERPTARLSEHQRNMKLMYHTIMTMTRLKRKIRRRRAAKAAAAGADPPADSHEHVPESVQPAS